MSAIAKKSLKEDVAKLVTPASCANKLADIVRAWTCTQTAVAAAKYHLNLWYDEGYCAPEHAMAFAPEWPKMGLLQDQLFR
mmetsp:Transcript_95232/g.169089  ORF Transcript_95232/g.169089 Transcript_95232/m.169089 type:complete len:81 (-) Transcript_95232:133-375(-)